MADADGQTLSGWVALAIALVALVWQALHSRHAAQLERLPSRAPFWAASGAWVLFGLLSSGLFGDRKALGIPLGLLCSAAGLLAVALLRWSRVDLPSLIEEEAAVAPPEEEEGEEEGLDSEGARLLRRIVRLRRRPIGELMLPFGRARSLRIGDSRDAALALFQRTASLRLPVWNEQGDAVLGAMEARDLVAHVPALSREGAGQPAPPFSLRPLLKPLPCLNPQQKAGEVLDILMRTPVGMGVVCDAGGAPQGLVSWDEIFLRLLARTTSEDGHEPG